MVCENIFETLSIPNQKSQGADMQRECSSHTMCHVSIVMCYVSIVICHVSCVMSHMSCVILSHVTCHLLNVQIIFPNIKKYKKYIYIISFKKMDKVVQLVIGGSVINEAYPVWIVSCFFNFLQQKVCPKNKCEGYMDLSSACLVDFGGLSKERRRRKHRKNCEQLP